MTTAAIDRLKSIIANGNAAEQIQSDTLYIMACHETHDAHCVGWLINQMGSGNNILLRLAMRGCENFSKIKLIGDQHERFEDTYPGACSE